MRRPAGTALDEPRRSVGRARPGVGGRWAGSSRRRSRLPWGSSSTSGCRRRSRTPGSRRSAGPTWRPCSSRCPCRSRWRPGPALRRVRGRGTGARAARGDAPAAHGASDSAGPRIPRRMPEGGDPVPAGLREAEPEESLRSPERPRITGNRGSFGFADPHAQVGYAYIPNQMGTHLRTRGRPRCGGRCTARSERRPQPPECLTVTWRTAAEWLGSRGRRTLGAQREASGAIHDDRRAPLAPRGPPIAGRIVLRNASGRIPGRRASEWGGDTQDSRWERRSGKPGHDRSVPVRAGARGTPSVKAHSTASGPVRPAPPAPFRRCGTTAASIERRARSIAGRMARAADLIGIMLPFLRVALRA